MKARGFHCSFCGRSRNEVNHIVAGAPQAAAGVPRQMVGKSAFICNECVQRCMKIISASDMKNPIVVGPKLA